MNVAAVEIRVCFEDGNVCVFTVSPSGSLSPANGDTVPVCDSCHWWEATKLLKQHGFKAPHGDATVKTPYGGMAWPWIFEEDEPESRW